MCPMHQMSRYIASLSLSCYRPPATRCLGTRWTGRGKIPCLACHSSDADKKNTTDKTIAYNILRVVLPAKCNFLTKPEACLFAWLPIPYCFEYKRISYVYIFSGFRNIIRERLLRTIILWYRLRKWSVTVSRNLGILKLFRPPWIHLCA